ncbi:MAG: type II toxin-antitoxin system HicA family toxin [Cytophagales bacterium]|nr:type II toxin-antitoxin system HicA family toxin [Cytophagales bacterium]
MKQITGKELCKILAKNGWQQVRISGSHHIFMKPNKNDRISVPVHANRNIKIGLLKAILKIAEINI